MAQCFGETKVVGLVADAQEVETNLFAGQPQANADIRKSILTLAVQGKLVPQDPNDEPAEAALARLEARGGNEKLRRSVPSDVTKPESVDEENLPESWAIESTARLLQLGAIL